MSFPCGRLLLAALLVFASSRAWAAEILWTRMTGQYPVESAPLVADVDQDGTLDIVAVNRAGQVMRWGLAGEDRGPGQDGTLLQLPDAGLWTSSPTLVSAAEGPRVLLASEKGLVVALDKTLTRILWQYQLSGPTEFARAMPALLPMPPGQSLCFADHTGTITCLSIEGKLLWKTELKTGKCVAEPLVLADKGVGPVVLAPCGAHLHALGPDGRLRWSQNLQGPIHARPELIVHDGKRVVACGGQRLTAVDPSNGKVLWAKELECETAAPLAVLSSAESPSLILHTSRWGNLQARQTTGQPVWQARFRSKTRSRPVVSDLDGDGHSEILVTAYNQHLYVFSDRGMLVDDVRLSGTLAAAPVLLQEPGQKHPDVLIVTATELAYRIRPGTPRSPYGATGRPEGLAIAPPDGRRAIVVENPHGALLRANLACRTEPAGVVRQGSLTARSRFELALPEGALDFQATVEDAQGRRLAELTGQSLSSQPNAPPVLGGPIRFWPTPAYAAFDETQLVPEQAEGGTVEIRNLYQNEVDQGAMVVAFAGKEPLRARVTVGPLLAADKTPFAGRLTLREVVATGTVNGERVADALPALGEAGLLTLLPQRAAKLWLSVDAHGAKPGEYTGQITLQPLAGPPAASTLPVRVEVLALALDKRFPLTLCTWDYIPNNWFPDQTDAVLDDMARHGVNVWPRTDCIPPARWESDRLVFDWTKLDRTLKQYKGRGQILFQINVPPISFPTQPTPEVKRQAELAYLRAWRDHLRQQGWEYGDYAFYPVDEPGLDYGKSLSVLLDAATLFREADPKFRIYTDPVPGLCWADFQRIEPLIDVWCPNMWLVNGLMSQDPRIRRIMGSNKTVWSYECVSQVKSLSPLRYNRAAAWRADFFGLQGIGFWTFSTTEADHWLPGKGINDEYALVYPGTLPVPSVRWEAVRDGLEDIAAVSLLKRAMAQRQPDAARAKQLQQAEAALRIARVDVLELSDETGVESRDYLQQGDRRLWHTRTDQDAFAQHRARIAELTKQLQDN